jgi:hypothetical protein
VQPWLLRPQRPAELRAAQQQLRRLPARCLARLPTAAALAGSAPALPQLLKVQEEMGGKDEGASLASGLAAELEELRAELEDTQAQLHERCMEVGGGGGARALARWGQKYCSWLDGWRRGCGGQRLSAPRAQLAGARLAGCRPARLGGSVPVQPLRSPHNDGEAGSGVQGADRSGLGPW